MNYSINIIAAIVAIILVRRYPRAGLGSEDCARSTASYGLSQELS